MVLNTPGITRVEGKEGRSITIIRKGEKQVNFTFSLEGSSYQIFSCDNHCQFLRHPFVEREQNSLRGQDKQDRGNCHHQ